MFTINNVLLVPSSHSINNNILVLGFDQSATTICIHSCIINLRGITLEQYNNFAHINFVSQKNIQRFLNKILSRKQCNMQQTTLFQCGVYKSQKNTYIVHIYIVTLG